MRETSISRVLLALALALSACGWAREEAQRLQYTRSAGAGQGPEEEQLRLRIAARLGYDPFRDDARSGFVVRLARHEDTWTAMVERVVSGVVSPAHRELQARGSTCDELASALELALALAIDPLAQL